MRFRFNGEASGTAKTDSAEALKNSFSIRWNNTINYTHPTNGLGGYFQLRYQPSNILVKGVDVKHSVSLHGGISYAFDFSNL